MADAKHEKIGAVHWVVAANAFLISMKLAVALMTGSIAVIATLVDSVFDLIGTGLAYFGVKKAAEPADVEHLYGHGKMESLSGFAQVMLIGATALFLIFEAIKRFFAPIPLEVTAFDVAAIGINIVIDVAMSAFLKRKTKETQSIALEASAANYASDVLQNSAVLAGLFLAQAGLLWADPIAAILISLLMLRVVYSAGRKAAGELLDISPTQPVMKKIMQAILSVKGVKSFHHLRARMVEGKALVDVHLQLFPKMTLKKAHNVSHQVRSAVLRRVPQAKDVFVHTEPEGDVEPGELVCPVELPEKPKAKMKEKNRSRGA